MRVRRRTASRPAGQSRRVGREEIRLARFDGGWWTPAGTPPLKIAILTVSDTRDQATDTSGAFLVEACRFLADQVEQKLVGGDQN